MDASMLAGGLVRRLQYLFGGLLFSFLIAQAVQAAPVVVSVDHRVAVSYSKPQLDARKGSYSVQVRITNKSDAPLLSPLRLSFDKAALGGLAIGNAQGTGADGRPYFDIKLPKEMLVPKASTDPISIAVVAERGRAVARIEQKFSFKALETAQHVSAGVEVAPLEPRAEPYALKVGSGKVTVRFSVAVVGKAKYSGQVYLRRVGGRDVLVMNDKGTDGDPRANDGVYVANVVLDTNQVKPDDCLHYEAFVRTGRVEIYSGSYHLCATEYPIRIASSNKKRQLELDGGVRVISDEILVTANANTTTATVKSLADAIGAVVVGSIPPLNLYQMRLPSPVNANQLNEIASRLKANGAVKEASFNAIGSLAYVPSDPEYPTQHGLQLVRADDVWDMNATGGGVTVMVLDSGLDRTHPDFGVPGDCQLATDAVAGIPDTNCGGTNNDSIAPSGHGTQVAGIIAAKTNNAVGVAGVSYGSKIYSIKITPDVAVADTEMIQGFTDAATYVSSHGGASIVNASFSTLNALYNWNAVCSAIDQLVTNGGVSRAIVVNAAGNSGRDGNYYPARCNDLNANLVNKQLLITVANSTSTLPIDPLCANAGNIDQRCGGTTIGVNNTSNYGAWIDIAAPGMQIRTTAAGGGYVGNTGTSFSAPMVAGAAAILKQCGVALDQIESLLRTATIPAIPIVSVPFPGGSSAPRLDVYRVLANLNHTPTGVSLTPNSINENTPTPLEVGTLTAIDADTCDKHTFTIVPQPMDDSGSFNIVGNKLNFNAGVVLDREAKASYTVTVHAVDFFGAATAADTTLTVTINDVNEFAVGAVTDTDPATNSVVENTTGAVGLTAHATDVDATNNTVTYTLPNNAGGRFSIDTNSGEVTATGSIDREAAASYDITVRATSSDGSFSDQNFTINIVDVNEYAVGPVTDSNAISNSVAENSSSGTSVGLTAQAVDADATNNKVTYMLTDDAGGRFAIDPDLGVVKVNGALDYETAINYSITVQASSADGSTSSATFSIAVMNVNEAPIANDDVVSATQDTPANYVNTVLTGNDTDEDAGTMLSIQSVSNPQHGAVMLNGDNSVTFTPDAGYSGPASFSYIATDGTLNSNNAMVTVNVAAVPHAPVANADTLLGTEDTPEDYQASALLGNDTDADVGTILSIASVSSGNGCTASLNPDGSVHFSPNANFNGAATFSYSATDGALGSNLATVTVNVAAVNDDPIGAPVISGTRTVGQTLTADASGIVDYDGLGTFHYQWLADGTPVGADSQFFPLSQTEFGKFMKVQVSYTDGGGKLETVDSVQDAVAIGDPHITTVDGLYYDFQSVGEFVALRGKKGMEIQLRMSPVQSAMPLTDPNSGLTSAVSVNTGLAARVGKHRVTYQSENGNAPTLRIDGAIVTLPPGGVDLGDGGRVSSQWGGIQIDFPDQTALIANASTWSSYNTWWLHVSVNHTPASEGIMGARSKGSWLPTLSDGSALGPMPALLHDRYTDLYVKFADSWRVTDKTSLFDYAEGTSTATYTDKSWPAENAQPVMPVVHNLLIAMPPARNIALNACRDVLGKNEKAACVFDVMAMGQVEAAKGHLQNQKVRLGATEVLLRAVDMPRLKGEVVYTATVKRLAAMAKQRERGAAIVPAGAVQFLLDGLPLGEPVKLDAKGQAMLRLSRIKMKQRNITARFVPAKGSVFLPSINKQAARTLKPVDPVRFRGIR